MKTTLAKNETVQRSWHLVDANGMTLGRLAVKIANILRGRHKADYTPHVDNGDFVVVINADKVKFTGTKEDDKKYMFYSGYFGNEKYRSVAWFRENRPEFLLEHAVKGMMPRNRLARHAIKKLKIFVGPEHDHQAQNPQPIDLSA